MKKNSCLLASFLVMMLYVKVPFAAEIPFQAFSINNVTVGITTVDEILKTYGKTKISKTSRDDEADITMCYVFSSPKWKSFLVFESGVMGNFKQITGFRISVLPQNVECLPSKTDMDTLITGNGVYLGQSLIDFKKSFPVKFQQQGSELIFEAVIQRTATPEELKKIQTNWPNETQNYFDVTITVKAMFKKNRLIDFYIHKVESY